MLQKIKLCLKHQIGSRGKRIVRFNQGLSVIIGPNGSGKSTILRAINECSDCIKEEDEGTKYHYFNSEIMNPHRSEDSFKGKSGSLIKVRAMFSSHGETMRDVLSSLVFQKGDCLLLDEPESGHDLDWIIKVRKGINQIARMGCQVIAASHHPIFWNKVKLIELKRNYNKTSCKRFLKNIELC